MKRLSGAAAVEAAPDVTGARIPEVIRARERALFARLAADSERGGRSTRLFVWASESGEADEDRPFRLGWKASLVLNLLLLFGPLGLVVALPPVLECREREERFGFFAGETLGTCASRGIRDRLKRLDDRIKMLVRDSGH